MTPMRMLVFALPLLLGCPQGGLRPPPTTPLAVVRAAAEPERIVDASGNEVSLDELVTALGQAEVVYLAERHDEAGDHGMQQHLFRALHHRDAHVLLGLEMLPASEQTHLEDWLAGNLDVSSFRRRVRWSERWGYDFAFYQPMFEFARSRGVPMRALNLPRSTTRAVAAGGIDALPEELRSTLPELDFDDAEHRALVLDALAEHPHGNIEHFYQAQVVWDETMAEAVATARQRTAAQVIVLAGRMHIQQGLGIPRRAVRRGAGSYRSVFAVDPDELEGFLDAPVAAADFYWVNAPVETE